MTTFQPLDLRHLEGALRLSRAAGWPHRPEDWELVVSISRGVVALDAGQIVATGIVTPFGGVGMVNMIIVDQKMRGRGLGRQIMERAMAQIHPAQWRLVATPAGQPLYEKLGFVACGQIRQHQGTVTDLPAVQTVRWATQDDMAGIADMDRDALAADRGSLLRALQGRGRIAIRPGKGYGVIRDFGRGRLIGPVVAKDLATARDLIAFLAHGLTGGFIRVDTTEESGLGPWLAEIGLAEVDRAVAMQTNDARPAGAFTRFALAAQALG